MYAVFNIPRPCLTLYYNENAKIAEWKSKCVARDHRNTVICDCSPDNSTSECQNKHKHSESIPAYTGVRRLQYHQSSAQEARTSKSCVDAGRARLSLILVV